MMTMLRKYVSLFSRVRVLQVVLLLVLANATVASMWQIRVMKRMMATMTYQNKVVTEEKGVILFQKQVIDTQRNLLQHCRPEAQF